MINVDLEVHLLEMMAHPQCDSGMDGWQGVKNMGDKEAMVMVSHWDKYYHYTDKEQDLGQKRPWRA